MPRQKNTASPVNNKVPATAAEGTNPPIAKEEKLYIKIQMIFLNNINILNSY